MKTTYYFGMMAAALAFVACSSDEELTPQQPVVPEAGENVGFVSTMGDQLEILATEDLDGGATRATMSDGAFGTWATSDKISVSDGTLMYTYSPKDGSIDGANCSFESKTSASFLTDGGGSEGTFYAFYPADAVLGWKGSTVSTMIYTEQKYSENVENSGVMGPYMAAVATTTGGGANASFTFGHICSVIDVDLSTFDGGKVESVALYANSQVSLAGSMRFDVNAKTATISGNDGAGYSNSLQSEVVCVSQINATQPTVRFYILPVKQTAGFTITVRCSDGKYYTKSSSNSVGSDATNDYITSQTGITNGTLCKPYYKKYKFGAKSSARTQNWMARIPGNIKFNHLSLPGAHDAASVGCTSQTNYTRCQSLNVENLLKNGCRALDLRPYYDDSNLTIYHGSYSANTTLASVLNNVTTFLDGNPTETVFVLIAQEGGSDGNTDWENRVWSCLNGYTSYIASYGWNGNLNPCRGKMVVIFRNTYTNDTNTGDLGCGKVGWGSSFNPKPIGTGSGNGTYNTGTLYYQDEYEYTSSSYVNEKLTNLEDMLTNYIAANETNAGYIYVNNTNCIKGSSVFGTIVINTNLTTSAAAVNEAVLASSTFKSHTGRFGIMMTDFLFSSDQKGDEMFELIHKQNYKYVYKNRSRCSTASTSGTDTGVDISTDEYADNGAVYVKGM